MTEKNSHSADYDAKHLDAELAMPMIISFMKRKPKHPETNLDSLAGPGYC